MGRPLASTLTLLAGGALLTGARPATPSALRAPPVAPLLEAAAALARQSERLDRGPAGEALVRVTSLLETVPLTVAPAKGAVIETVSGVVSGGRPENSE
jgi:hypothetical protein